MGLAELQRKLDVAGDDIALIKRRLDDSQGVYFEHSLHRCAYNVSLMLKIVYWACMIADGVAAVEVLRAELARAKEQAQWSNVAAKKALAELKAEQAARYQDEERISSMALEFKNAARRCEFLEKENEAKMAELDKALREAREARSEYKANCEEIRQAGEIAAGKPFLL